MPPPNRIRRNPPAPAAARHGQPSAEPDRGVLAHDAEAAPIGADVRPLLAGARRPRSADLLRLQRLVGNRAVSTLLQRKGGAAPQNYVVGNGPTDDTTATVESISTWSSSTGQLGDLDDVQTREVIDFGEDPRVKVPGYAVLLQMDPKFQLAGNILTKGPDSMQSGRATDKHSGAGYGTKFTLNGIANLQAGDWTLTGAQHYEYKQAGGAWQPLPGAFVITRRMAKNVDHYELTQTKTGPGVNLAAGPANINFETRDAMAKLTAARPNQDADWARDSGKLTQAGLVLNYLGVNQQNIGTPPQIVNVYYREFRPGGVVDPTLRGPGGGQFVPPGAIEPSELTRLFDQSKQAIETIVAKALGAGGHAPPATIEFYFYPEGAGAVRQQSYFTSAGGGSYKVLLKGKDASQPGSTGQKGALAGNATTSIAGKVGSGAWTKAGKLERFCKATAVHEMGHMLHALNAPEIFLQSTIMPGPGNPIQPNNPLYPESVHVAQTNASVLAAFNTAIGTKAEWGYAKANPAEMVCEGFTAIMSGKSVPKPVAAVYVAYGGPRSTIIDNALRKAFPGKTIPGMNQPEDCIAHM